MLRKTGPRHDTLLRTVHADAERPAIVVLVKHADQRTSLELELVSHGRLKVKLHTMDVVGATGRSVRTTGSSSSSGKASSASGACNHRRTHSWGGGNIFCPRWACGDTIGVGGYRGRRRELLLGHRHT